MLKVTCDLQDVDMGKWRECRQRRIYMAEHNEWALMDGRKCKSISCKRLQIYKVLETRVCLEHAKALAVVLARLWGLVSN